MSRRARPALGGLRPLEETVQVVSGSSEQLWVIVEPTKQEVVLIAQQPADLAGVVAVVHVEVLIARLLLRFAPADRAASTLCGQHCLVLDESDAVLPE